jgi:CHAT domain-containing protein
MKPAVVVACLCLGGYLTGEAPASAAQDALVVRIKPAGSEARRAECRRLGVDDEVDARIVLPADAAQAALLEIGAIDLRRLTRRPPPEDDRYVVAPAKTRRDELLRFATPAFPEDALRIDASDATARVDLSVRVTATECVLQASTAAARRVAGDELKSLAARAAAIGIALEGADSAATLMRDGRFADALARIEPALEALRAAAGETHRTVTLLEFLRLGAIAELDRPKETAAACGAIEARLRRQHPEHPDALEAARIRSIALVRAGVPVAERVAAAEGPYREYAARYGAEHVLTLLLWKNYATILWQAGDYAAALRETRAAFEAAQRTFGESALATLEARNNYALVLWDTGQPQQAVDEFEATVRPGERAFGATHPFVVDALANLGLAQRSAGLVTESLATLRRAYVLYLQTRGPAHNYTLTALTNLAGSYAMLGRHEEAEALNREAYLGLKATVGDDHPDTAIALYNYSVSVFEQGRFADAEPLLREAAVRLNAALGPKHIATVRAIAQLPLVAIQLGRTAEGYAEIERAARASNEALGVDHPTSVELRLTLAYHCLDVRPARACIDRLEHALEEGARTLEESRHARLRTELQLARALQADGRTDEARRTLGALIERIEQIRSRWAIAAESRRAILALHADAFRALAALDLAQARAGNALQVLERVRGRGLLEVLRNAAASREAGLGEDDARALVALERRMQALAERIAQAELPAEREPLSLERDALAVSLGQLRAQLAAKYPRYARLTRSTEVPLARAAAALPRDAAYLTWFVAEDVAYALVVKPGGTVRAVALGKAPELADRVAAWRHLLQKGVDESALRVWQKADGRYVVAQRSPDPAARRVQRADEVGASLARLLLAPIRADLKGARRLIVTVDGPLAFLPLEALPLDADVVASRYVVSYAVSLAVFAQQRAMAAPATARPTFLAMGAPSYGQAPATAGPTAGTPVPAVAARVETALALGARESWPPLPGAEREVKSVAAIFSGSTVLLGADASEDRLQQLNASGELARHRYVLISAHGLLSAENPERSAIVLRQPGSERNDGYVTASEWAGYTLRADLVVLSACETGLGRQVAGEGTMGLPYALFVAGSRNTLLSIWKVPDASGAEFMIRFFRRVHAGMSQSLALATTKREFLHDPRYRDPVHWAGFVLYGS